jgi:hypothetical protein
MAESDEEGADISNVLLETAGDTENPFSFNGIPSTKRRKRNVDKNGFVEDFDSFSNETPIKSKLNGSSFKNMGTTPSWRILTARIWSDAAESNYSKGL